MENFDRESENESLLLRLPNEIVEMILLSDMLTHEDLGRMARVCTMWRDVCYSNELWKQKLRKRWHHMLDRYDRTRLFNYHWYTEYKNRHLFGIKVRKMVEELSPQYYDCDEISKEGFSDFGELLTEHEHAGDFLVDELMEIVHEGDKHCDLTTRYYAVKVLRYLQQQHISQKIKAFLQLPLEQQKLETDIRMPGKRVIEVQSEMLLQ